MVLGKDNNDMKRAMAIAESTSNGREKPYALAVPIYSYEIDGEFNDYLGVKVWNELQNYSKDFNFVPIEIRRFGDSSRKAVVMRSVRNKKVYTVHPIYCDTDGHRGVAMACIDAVNRGHPMAGEHHMVEPYNRDWRQDTPKGRENLTAHYTPQFYAYLGLTRYFCFDPHFKQLPAVFPPSCPAECFDVTQLFADHLRESEIEGLALAHVQPIERIDTADGQSGVVKIASGSPDEGGLTRTRRLASKLGEVPVILAYTGRDFSTVDRKEVILITGDPEEMHVVERDDVAGTCGTLLKINEALMSRGAYKVSAAPTFMDFCSHGAYNLWNAGIKCYGTDGVPLRGRITVPRYVPDMDDPGKKVPLENPREVRKAVRDNISVISLAPTIAEAVARDATGESLRKFFY